MIGQFAPILVFGLFICGIVCYVEYQWCKLGWWPIVALSIVAIISLIVIVQFSGTSYREYISHPLIGHPYMLMSPHE